MTWRARIGSFNAPRIKEVSKLPLEATFNEIISNLIAKFSLLLTLLNLTHTFFICSMIVILFFFFNVVFFLKLNRQYSTNSFTNYIMLTLSPSISCSYKWVTYKAHNNTCRILTCSLGYIFFSISFSLINQLLLIVSGSVEVHPGPRSNEKLNQFFFAFWNLNSLVARDGARLTQIEALIANTNFHIFGICESSLSKDIPNEKIKIHGFSPSPFRADCPNTQDHRKGGVALYYRENLPIKERPDLLSGLEETIVAEIEFKNKKSIFYILSYRSPSQKKDEYAAYFKKIESVYVSISKLKPAAIILNGDFNARSPLFWDNESTETPEGKHSATL